MPPKGRTEDSPALRRRTVLADASTPPVESSLGARLRAERLRTGKSVRALAKDIGISPSALSQFETGKARPSVDTLYTIVNLLEVSLDDLFEPTGAPEKAPVQDGLCHPTDRQIIQLESGVQWQRLTAHADPNVDFLYVIYDVGGSSAANDAFVRHSGREYGYVQSGLLRVQHGFDVYEMGPGDSISFDSAVPHRLETLGDEPVHAIWLVLDRD
jgi:transcriptional regulator with XRE-family HTH domain